MTKKKIFFLIVLAFLVFGYFKLFYKTYSKNVVPQSADAIIAIDVKRITNSLLWQFISTPQQWKIGNLFSKKKDKTPSWQKMIVLPDYIFAFHLPMAKAHEWYIVFEIKNKATLLKGLSYYDFKKIDDSTFSNMAMGLHLILTENKLIVYNASLANSGLLQNTIQELFITKKYASSATLNKIIKAKSHLAIYVEPNKFLQEDAVIKANFTKNTILINALLKPKNDFIWNENNFKVEEKALLNFGLTQPPTSLLSMMNKEKIGRILNVSIDSIFRSANKNYQLHLKGFKEKTDTALTYTYDDNFNKIENRVAIKIVEPEFSFKIMSSESAEIEKYLTKNNILEQTPTGKYYTAIPFVKSYFAVVDDGVKITTQNFTAEDNLKEEKAIIYFNLFVRNIPNSIKNYLPNRIQQVIAPWERVTIKAQNVEKNISVNIEITKRQDALSVLKFK